MIESFGNRATQDFWERDFSKELPKELWTRAKALLTIMNSTRRIEDLRIQGQPPKIRLHKLSGSRSDYWSVTIRLPWCITFKFQNGEFQNVRIENYHRG